MKISVNESISSTVASTLTRDTPFYIVYNDKEIGGHAPVSGSSIHAQTNNCIKRGLSTWSELVNSDSSAIKNAQEALRSVDGAVKSKLLDAMQ